jgi:hypothetical protein
MKSITAYSMKCRNKKIVGSMGAFNGIPDAMAEALHDSQYSPGCFPCGQECEVSWPKPSFEVMPKARSVIGRPFNEGVVLILPTPKGGGFTALFR